MRSLAMVTLGLLLALAVPALAQCPAGTTEVVPSQPEQSMIIPSVPAVIGAGPAPTLSGLSGTAFDEAYIRQMYLLHHNISALATIGIEQTMNKDLKDLSGKIRYEQTTQNEKLALWYRDNLSLGKIPLDYSKVQAVADSLVTFTGPEFDIRYAQTLSGLLQQAHDAAVLGTTNATLPALRDQAGVVVKSTSNEITALQKWIPQQGVPAVTGQGPMQPVPQPPLVTEPNYGY